MCCKTNRGQTTGANETVTGQYSDWLTQRKQCEDDVTLISVLQNKQGSNNWCKWNSYWSVLWLTDAKETVSRGCTTEKCVAKQTGCWKGNALWSARDCPLDAPDWWFRTWFRAVCWGNGAKWDVNYRLCCFLFWVQTPVGALTDANETEVKRMHHW